MEVVNLTTSELCLFTHHTLSNSSGIDNAEEANISETNNCNAMYLTNTTPIPNTFAMPVISPTYTHLPPTPHAKKITSSVLSQCSDIMSTISIGCDNFNDSLLQHSSFSAHDFAAHVLPSLNETECTNLSTPNESETKDCHPHFPKNLSGNSFIISLQNSPQISQQPRNIICGKGSNLNPCALSFHLPEMKNISDTELPYVHFEGQSGDDPQSILRLLKAKNAD